MKRLLAQALLVLPLVAACGLSSAPVDSASPPAEGSTGVEVSRAELGAAWPLTVDSGVLDCTGAGAVTFTTAGTTYAVNGMAMGMHQFADIGPIWAKDKSGNGGPKKDISPLIERGLEICT